MDVWFVRCSHIVRGRSLYVTLHFFRQILVDTESFGTDIGCLKGGHPSPKFLKQVKQRLFLLQYQTQICLRSFIGTSLLLVDSGMLRAIFPLRWLQQQSPAVTPQLLRHCRDSTGTGGYQLRLSSWFDVFGPSMTFISRGECPSKVDAWVAYSHEWRSTHLLRWAMGLTIPGQ